MSGPNISAVASDASFPVGGVSGDLLTLSENELLEEEGDDHVFLSDDDDDVEDDDEEYEDATSPLLYGGGDVKRGEGDLSML
jgi:hypothetical protein